MIEDIIEEKFINMFVKFRSLGLIQSLEQKFTQSSFYKFFSTTIFYKKFKTLSVSKKIFTIAYIIFFVHFLILFLIGGYTALENSDLWIFFSISAVLVLPNLISKVVFRKQFISIYSILGLFIYPAAYFLIYFGSNLGISDFQVLSRAFFIFVVLVSNILVLYYVFYSPVSEIKNAKKHLFPIVIGSILYVIILLLIRQNGSILALDYLQHQAAVNGMVNGDILCIIPNQCSNLFLKAGYTTFYHSILGVFGSYAGNNLVRVFYVLDFVWGILGISLLYKFFITFLKRRSLSIFAALISIFVFVNGAYDFVFFIPQTLAFYIFISLFLLKKFKFIHLILGIIMLLLIHFIIGAYLSILLIIYFLYKNKYLDAIINDNKFNRYFLYSLIPLLVVILLSSRGFSIEQNFQASDIQSIGSATNLSFPDNLLFIYNTLGIPLVFVLFSIWYFLKDKNRLRFGMYALVYLFIGISIYVLGPTYANKFLIGLGIFSSILVVNYLIDTRMSIKLYGLVSIMIIVIYIFNFAVNYNTYSEFYSQRDGTVSAVTFEDSKLVNYLNSNFSNSCTIISDPYSQIMVAGLTKNQTAAAQYISPESRQSLYNFINTPSSLTWNSLINIDELKNSNKNNICFLYSSRLEETLKANNTNWLNNTYSLPLNNDYSIKELPKSVEYLQNSGYGTFYKTGNFILLGK